MILIRNLINLNFDSTISERVCDSLPILRKSNVKTKIESCVGSFYTLGKV